MTRYKFFNLEYLLSVVGRDALCNPNTTEIKPQITFLLHMFPIVCKLPHKTLTEVPKTEENGVRFRVPDVYCPDMHTLSLEETINT